MNRFILSVAACCLVFTVSLAQAGGLFHAPPFDFLFGNHIDTHQENKLKLYGSGNPESLTGKFYIISVDEDADGNTDIDSVSGLE
ncbi:MAG: hypothetical protein U9P00_04805, partial [Pseudomonadota bacterium]|nr:hypothetical protein [Pseudomonadota bacterium]